MAIRGGNLQGYYHIVGQKAVCNFNIEWTKVLSTVAFIMRDVTFPLKCFFPVIASLRFLVVSARDEDPSEVESSFSRHCSLSGQLVQQTKVMTRNHVCFLELQNLFDWLLTIFMFLVNFQKIFALHGI